MPSPSSEVPRARLEARKRRQRWHARPACRALRAPVLVWFGVACLCGCSSMRGISDYQEGWRRAVVVRVGNAKEMESSAMTDCRTSANGSELSSSRFALLSYRVGQRRHLHIVSVQKTAVLKPGDTVFTNILRCGGFVEVLSSNRQEVGVLASQSHSELDVPRQRPNAARLLGAIARPEPPSRTECPAFMNPPIGRAALVETEVVYE